MSAPTPMKLTPARYSFKEAFAPDLPDDQYVDGFAPSTCEFVPQGNPDWVWDRNILRDLIVWWQEGAPEPLYVFGHTGAGKSGALRQFCASLRIPMYEKTIYEGLEFETLVVNVDLAGGNSISSYAWLPLAMGAEGYPGIFVPNEIDRADPGMLVGLYEVLEGQPIAVHMGGLTHVRPSPVFRMAATGNTSLGGQGTDGIDLYVSAQQQDIAFQDRCWKVKVSYLDADSEKALLERLVPQLDVRIREPMVEIANDIRALFMGQSDSANAISLTMSTRTLIRWARMTWSFRGAEARGVSPIRYALDRALLFAADAEPPTREAILRLVQGKFGDAMGGV